MKRAILLRDATPADLVHLVDAHSRARVAYYQAGGVAPETVQTPAGEQQQWINWNEAVQSSSKRVLCAVIDGEVVGVAAMGPPLTSDDDPDEVRQLYQIHVIPGRWRGGIGSRLHSAFVNYLAENALCRGLLEVWERNKIAQAFYAKHGWQPTGRRRTDGPDGTSYVYLRLHRGDLLDGRPDLR